MTFADPSANMPEVMKTRLQLQGELQRADANAPRVYKNVLDVFAKTWKNEGVRGLQRGLLPAVSHSIHALQSATLPLIVGSMATRSSSMAPV